MAVGVLVVVGAGSVSVCAHVSMCMSNGQGARIKKVTAMVRVRVSSGNQRTGKFTSSMQLIF